MANKDLQSWARLDDSWLHHPKHRRAGLFGRALWVAAMCYSHRLNTDGDISADVIDLLATEAGLTMEQASEAASKLMEVGLWELQPDGWHIHDYEHCQETAAEREDRRSQDRERQRRRRAKQVADQQKRDTTLPVTRDTSVSHGGVTGPEAEAEAEADRSLTTRCRGETRHDGTSQPTSINVPPDGGISVDDRFEEFWGTWPPRDGRRVGKAQAVAQWRRLTPDQRTQALTAVTHYAAERGGPGQTKPADAHRWLRDHAFTEWAEPPNATAAANGRAAGARLRIAKGP